MSPFKLRNSDLIDKLCSDVWAFVVRRSGQGPTHETPDDPSSPTPTPSRAVKFGDAPSYQAASDCAMMLRAYHVRMRCPRSAVQGRLAAAYVSVSELPHRQKTPRQSTQSSRHLCCR